MKMQKKGKNKVGGWCRVWSGGGGGPGPVGVRVEMDQELKSGGSGRGRGCQVGCEPRIEVIVEKKISGVGGCW